MKRIVLLCLVAFALVIAGCRSSPVVNKFMNPDLPTQEHALLSIDNNIGVGMIDGEFTFKSSGSGSDGSSKSRTPMILLMPGRHTLMVQYVHQTTNTSGNRKTKTTRTSDTIPVTGNFLSGHNYKLQPEVNGDTVSFNFIDENDPDIWKSKNLSSVKPPKKTPNFVLIIRAASKGATRFEGAWAVKGMPGAEFVFTGESYTSKMTIELNDAQLKGQNDLRRTSGQSTLRSPAFNAQRGTFVVKGNQITTGQLQMTLDNDVDNALWGDTSKTLNTTYEYSFNSEGDLVLTFKSGKQALNPFSRERELVLIKK